MKIGYVGDFAHTWSTEAHVAQSLAMLGHDVTAISKDVSYGTLVDLASAVELLVYVQGPWSIDDMRACPTPTASYHLDLFIGLAREQRIATDAIFGCDVVCTPDDGHHDAWQTHGICHRAVRAGVFGPEAVDVEPDERWAEIDVAFVGSTLGYHREWPHRLELLDRLAARYGRRFVALPGTQPRLHGADLNSLYATVPVIVGDSCFANPFARYWSDRPYEVWGRGGFLVMPYIACLADEIGDYPSWHIGRWDELFAQVDEALAEPEYRDISRRCHGGRVRERCTYEQRAVELLAAIAR